MVMSHIPVDVHNSPANRPISSSSSSCEFGLGFKVPICLVKRLFQWLGHHFLCTEKVVAKHFLNLVTFSAMLDQFWYVIQPNNFHQQFCLFHRCLTQAWFELEEQ